MSIAGMGRAWAGLLLLMLGYAVLFAAYYPPLSGIEDEVGYVNQALVWSRGVLTSEAAGWPDLAGFAPVRSRHVGTRNPGRSLLATPFLWMGGGRAVFVSGLALHLAITGIGAASLARLGRSPLWAALLLCHPTLAIYSRTVMAGAGAGAGLLLAALAVTYPSAAAPLGAGLAVGGAALMRYHAGLALPWVALTFRFAAGRPHPWRVAALCSIAGGLLGTSIIACNVAIHDAPLERPATQIGYFSTEYLVPHLAFYGASLMLVWPGMLPAPLLDRSAVRWLVRGICGLYLGMFAVYYFHDRTPRWLETLIVGQRLLQVALPVWIVSYAGVVDDRIAMPLRRRLGVRGREILAMLGCAGLLASSGVIFARHQQHLNGLRDARDELVEHAPEGSLIVYRGDLDKLIGTPVGVPSYRLRELEFHGKPAEEPRMLFHDLERETRPWTLAVLHRHPGEPLSDHARGDRALRPGAGGRPVAVTVALRPDGRAGAPPDLGTPGTMSAGPIRLALVCDYPEEGWPSMDLVGDMILAHLGREHAGEVAATRVCPPFRRRFTRLPRFGASSTARNADRLLNRLVDYPRMLRGVAGQGEHDLYHLVDHSYSQLVHVLPPGRTVVTCHDLDTFRCLLEPGREPRPRWFRAMARHILDGLRKAAAVVCDSEATRRGLRAHDLVREGLLHVVPLDTHPECTPASVPEADARAARLIGAADPERDAPPELLHVGSNIPRKRIDVLLGTLAGVRRECPGARLIKVGGALTPDQARLARDLGVADAIVVLPFLDRATLAAVYRRAALVLLPSEAEGFGLPLAESLACGVPVLACAIAVLHEVGGTAATYLPVGDVAAWTAATLQLLDDRRRQCDTWHARRAAGLARARQFHWSTHVRQLATLYRTLLN